MSVSTVLIAIFLDPQSAACLQCKIILVSASSWLQGDINDRSRSALLHTTSSFRVISTSLSVTLRCVTSARKLNSSDLLLLTCKKSAQFLGILVFAVTRVCDPVPLRSLHAAFRLSGKYTSN